MKTDESSPINRSQFSYILKNIINTFKNKNLPNSRENDVLLIKCYNTIKFNDYYDTTSNKLINTFNIHRARIISQYKFQISIGMSLFSKELDLSIGGVPNNKNSFRIIR